jgi:hypothetical protein
MSKEKEKDEGKEFEVKGNNIIRYDAGKYDEDGNIFRGIHRPGP